MLTFSPEDTVYIIIAKDPVTANCQCKAVAVTKFNMLPDTEADNRFPQRQIIEIYIVCSIKSGIKVYIPYKMMLFSDCFRPVNNILFCYLESECPMITQHPQSKGVFFNSFLFFLLVSTVKGYLFSF